MCDQCGCQCNCSKKDIPFSKLPRGEQERLKRDGGFGLSRKLLSKEALAHREKLDLALALDASKRRNTQRAFEAFNDNLDKR